MLRYTPSVWAYTWNVGVDVIATGSLKILSALMATAQIGDIASILRFGMNQRVSKSIRMRYFCAQIRHNIKQNETKRLRIASTVTAVP